LTLFASIVIEDATPAWRAAAVDTNRTTSVPLVLAGDIGIGADHDGGDDEHGGLGGLEELHGF